MTTMQNDRRKYFRYTENLMMSYSLQGDDSQSKEEIQALNLIEDFSHMSQQLKSALGRIPGRAMEIANCLKILDTKINLLAQSVLYQKNSAVLSQHRINLSAGGLSFSSEEPIPIDSILTIQLILPPELDSLNLRARVVNCHKQKEDKQEIYCVSVTFIEVSDMVQDIIVRHIMRCQAEELRIKKEYSTTTT